MLSSLTDIVSPLAVSHFLQAFHEKRRLHIQTIEPARGERLLPWKDIETMISMRSFDDMQVMQSGMPLPPQLYTSNDMGDLHDILAQGASIVLRQVQLHVPQIQWLATAIERQMGFAVGVNAYLSFARGGAFKPHWDKHDVLVIQVHGTKTWRLWDGILKNPIESSNRARYEIDDAHSEELELAPGDALYIPRGEPHAASVCAGASVHLTFGLDSLTGVDVLQQLQHAAGHDEFLRADLPPQVAEAQLRDYEVELKARLHRLVDALDIAEFLKADDANRAPIRHASLALSDEPTDILRLTLRRQVRLPDGGSGESQPVTIGGVEYPLSPVSIDILRQLFGNDCQSRSALSAALSPLHTKAAVTAGVRELLRLGFLMTDRAV
jgi:hypothetical protein